MDARDYPNRFLRHDRNQLAYGGLVRLLEQSHEGFVLELAAEQGAHAGSGQAEPMFDADVSAKDERIAEHPSDRCRLDVDALRCCAVAALPIPVREQFAARGMFHRGPLSNHRSFAFHPGVPIRDARVRQVRSSTWRAVPSAGRAWGSAPLPY